MAETLDNSGLMQVRLVTPDKLLVNATASAVELPAMSGYMETLYGAKNLPLLAELGAGEVRLHGGTSGDRSCLCRPQGFVEVLPDRVTILAETALRPNEIDPAEAQAELKHSQEMWDEAGDDAEKYDDANATRPGRGREGSRATQGTY